MAGSESLPGAREHDAEKSEHAIRDVIACLVSALYLSRLFRLPSSAIPEPIPAREDSSQFSDRSRIEVLPSSSEADVLAGRPESEALPSKPDVEELSGQAEPELLTGRSGATALPGQPVVPALGDPSEAGSIASTRQPLLDPTISITVGEEVIESPLSRLSETLNQQPPETLEHMRSALQDVERSPEAPTVEIRADGQIKFYRDDFNTFASQDFDRRQTASVEERIETPSVQDIDRESLSLQDEYVAEPDSLDITAEPLQPSQGAIEDRMNAPSIGMSEVEAPPQIRQIPVSEAEVLASQNLGDTSTSNPEIWGEQPQVYAVEVDANGNMRPTAPLAQGLESVASQVERSEEIEAAAETYEEFLDDRRERRDARAEAYDALLDDRRERSDARAEAYDAHLDSLGAASASASSSSRPDAVAEVSERHQRIGGMLDQVFDHCFIPGSGKEVIQGNHFILERDGDHLSVTARERGKVVLEKQGDDIRSSLTSADQEILENGFNVLAQQQRLMQLKAETPTLATSAPTPANMPVAAPPTTQMEL